jgi:hypothetical protein
MLAPLYSKLRKDCITGIGHAWCNGVNKTFHFFIFQLPKENKDHGALAKCGRVKFPKLR